MPTATRNTDAMYPGHSSLVSSFHKTARPSWHSPSCVRHLTSSDSTVDSAKAVSSDPPCSPSTASRSSSAGAAAKPAQAMVPHCHRSCHRFYLWRRRRGRVHPTGWERGRGMALAPARERARDHPMPRSQAQQAQRFHVRAVGVAHSRAVRASGYHRPFRWEERRRAAAPASQR